MVKSLSKQVKTVVNIEGFDVSVNIFAEILFYVERSILDDLIQHSYAIKELF